MKGIYIFINKSFKDNEIKIGYSDDIERRREELSKSTAISREFELYAYYEVDEKLTDKSLHKMIKILNPNLRINEKKEFFAIEPKKAYDFLDCMAKIHNRSDKLHLLADETEINENNEDTEYYDNSVLTLDKKQDLTGTKINAVIINDKKIGVKSFRSAFKEIIEYLKESYGYELTEIMRRNRQNILYASGQNLHTPYEIFKNQLYVEMNRSSNDIWKHIRILLQELKLDLTKFAFIVEKRQ